MKVTSNIFNNYSEWEYGLKQTNIMGKETDNAFSAPSPHKVFYGTDQVLTEVKDAPTHLQIQCSFTFVGLRSTLSRDSKIFPIL